MRILITALLAAGALLPGLAQTPATAPAPEASTPPAPKVAEPFAFADFSWLNGNCREKDAILDTKYFTGEFRADVNAVYDFNHPQDHTLVAQANWAAPTKSRSSSWASGAISTGTTCGAGSLPSSASCRP